MALNLYRYAVKAAWERAGAECDELSHIMDSVVMLLPLAWSGGTAGDMVVRVGAFQSDARKAAGAVIDVCEQTWGLEPVEVPAESWKYQSYV